MGDVGGRACGLRDIRVPPLLHAAGLPVGVHLGVCVAEPPMGDVGGRARVLRAVLGRGVVHGVVLGVIVVHGVVLGAVIVPGVVRGVALGGVVLGGVVLGVALGVVLGVLLGVVVGVVLGDGMSSVERAAEIRHRHPRRASRSRRSTCCSGQTASHPGRHEAPRWPSPR